MEEYIDSPIEKEYPEKTHKVSVKFLGGGPVNFNDGSIIKNPASGADIVESVEISNTRVGREDPRFGSNRIVPTKSLIQFRSVLLYDTVVGDMVVPAQGGRLYKPHEGPGFAVGLNTRKKYRPRKSSVCRWVVSLETQLTRDNTRQAVADAVFKLAYPEHDEPQEEFPTDLIFSDIARSALKNETFYP